MNAPLNMMQRIKVDLQLFWSHFWNDEGYYNPRLKSKKFKLNLLREYSDRVYKRLSKEALSGRREKFVSNKGMKKKFRYPCFVCGRKSEERHHIIELQNGGINSKKNVIPICHKCHCSIHPWLQ
jgi:HNH endonuclease